MRNHISIEEFRRWGLRRLRSSVHGAATVRSFPHLCALSSASGLFVLLALVSLVAITRGTAQLNGVISYQGRVQVSGVPFEGTGQFKFALVDALGVQFLWRNSPDLNLNGEPDQFATLNVTRGLYHVYLGDTALVGASHGNGGFRVSDC